MHTSLGVSPVGQSRTYASVNMHKIIFLACKCKYIYLEVHPTEINGPSFQVGWLPMYSLKKRKYITKNMVHICIIFTYANLEIITVI